MQFCFSDAFSVRQPFSWLSWHMVEPPACDGKEGKRIHVARAYQLFCGLPEMTVKTSSCGYMGAGSNPIKKVPSP